MIINFITTVHFKSEKKMGSERFTCSGCALLCDDIIVRSDGLYIDEVIGACLKGKERFDQVTAKNRISYSLIKKNGGLEKASFKEALDKAIKIIKNSSNPLLYGFSTVSCEAQLKGIELARMINGFIDSNSIICQGKVLNTSKETGITLTSLAEIINKADLLILWGANPAESIPRLLNKVLFSRGKFRMTGREIKTLIVIDPVKTASFGVMGVRDVALQIEMGKDIELIRTIRHLLYDRGFTIAGAKQQLKASKQTASQEVPTSTETSPEISQETPQVVSGEFISKMVTDLETLLSAVES